MTTIDDLKAPPVDIWYVGIGRTSVRQEGARPIAPQPSVNKIYYKRSTALAKCSAQYKWSDCTIYKLNLEEGKWDLEVAVIYPETCIICEKDPGPLARADGIVNANGFRSRSRIIYCDKTRGSRIWDQPVVCRLCANEHFGLPARSYTSHLPIYGFTREDIRKAQQSLRPTLF